MVHSLPLTSSKRVSNLQNIRACCIDFNKSIQATLLTMSSNLSTQVGSTLCLSVRCRERDALSGCPCWHRGHNHAATTLLSLHAVSPDSSYWTKISLSGRKMKRQKTVFLCGLCEPRTPPAPNKMGYNKEHLIQQLK